QKCLITRRLGEFARSPGILESRLTEKFVLDEDYLYNAEVTHGNIRCFLGEFEEIKEYIEICEKKFGIKVEAEAHENAVKQLHSLVLVQREDKRNSTALGLIYLIFGAAKGRNLDTLDMKSIYDIIGEKAEFKSIFESIYMNSWNEEQRKLARAMKLLNEVSEDYIFNKLVVERAYEAYHGNLEGYELALETLLKVRAINCNGYITFWHPFQLDVVDLYLSISVKIDIIEKLISNLERCLHSVNESERMELLLSLVKLSFSIDRSKSVGFVKALKTENEHFYRIGSMFVISQISEEFLSDFDFKHIRAFFRMVSTEDLADKETRMITLSFICFLTVLGSRENKEKLVDDIMTLASEELEDDEQINFYSSCVSRIAESGLPGKEKEEWIAKIETMARKTLKKEKGQINFYSICVSRIAQSRLLGKEKDKWIAEIETMARKTLEKGKEHANFYSICVSNIAQSGLPGKEKEEWIAKIETMARKTLKKGEEQVNFYSLCISNIVKSRLPGKEKEEWIEKIETMARKTLEKGEEQENFYSLCISNIVKSGLPGKEKEEWIEKIETMARKTLEKGEEQENFYSLCISNLAQSRLPGKEKEEWIAEIETMARKTLEKGEEQADFYSICVSRIAQSGLPRKRKLRYVNLICSVVKTFNHNYQQEIFSYCLLRIAFFRLPCIFARTILSNSSDKEELIKRCEDLSIDLSSGEKSLEIIFYLQDCLKQPSREPTIPR
ncbi:MAG: hypothetical protein HXS54_16310, partial [Theionarchaea archaeon]|nr:hypothetical protein [Theionarchaea archaeon]